MWTIFSRNRKCFPFCRKKIQGIWKVIKVPLTSVLWCNSCKCRRPEKDNTVLRCIFLHKFSWYRPPCLHFCWIAQIPLAFIPCILQPMFLLLIRLTLQVIWWKSESIIFYIHADISNHCRFISFWGPSMTKKKKSPSETMVLLHAALVVTPIKMISCTSQLTMSVPLWEWSFLRF